jgi:hypothetical protein
MATSTDIQESAQALFCALANRVGTAGLAKFFDKEKFPTYLDFKTNWNKTFKTLNIEKAFRDHVKSGKASLSQIEDLLHGVKETSKYKKHDWYYSSLEIAKKLIQDIAKISNKFSYVKAGNWQDVFWRHGDKEVMDNMVVLFKKANDYQKVLVKNGNGGKIARPFADINKWTTADIYFAAESAKKQIVSMVKESKLDYVKLNSFISKLIAEGTLLPLSLKKQPDRVTIKKVNFNRPQEEKDIDILQYGGHSDWKPYVPNSDISNYTRTLIIYMSKDKKLKMQLRHDPSTGVLKGIVQIVGAGAFEGSLSAGPIADILKGLDAKFSDTWMKDYNAANKIFVATKKILDNEIKAKDRKRYDNEREMASALVTNVTHPSLLKWLDKNKARSDMFIRSVYTYATARSDNSAKYVIAK